MFMAFMHYRRRLCKHIQGNIPPGQSLLPTKDIPSEQSTPLCTALHKRYFLTEPLPEPSLLLQSNIHAAARAPQPPNPASCSSPHSQTKGETGLTPAQTCTKTPSQDACGESFKELCTCSEAFPQHPQQKQFPQGEHPKYHTVTTDLTGVKPPQQTATSLCRQTYRYRVGCS